LSRATIWVCSSSPFHHRLGQLDQQIQQAEIALADGDPERLHVEPVAGKHAGLVAPGAVGGRPAAAHLGVVDHVVMHQRGGVDHLDDGSQADRGVALGAAGAGAQQHQRRTQALAAAELEVTRDLGDRVDRADRVEADELLHPAEIRPDQGKNLTTAHGRL
jgi:hypothetical protein